MTNETQVVRRVRLREREKFYLARLPAADQGNGSSPCNGNVAVLVAWIARSSQVSGS